MTLAARKNGPVFAPDQRVVFRADWALYQALDASRGEASRPRLAYLDGELEVLMPGERHERLGRQIARLLEVWSLVKRVPIAPTGSWTLKKARRKAAAEGDASWIVGDRTGGVPDLELEVVETHGGLDKLEIYARLGVREVWFVIDGKLSVHVLRGVRYLRAARSHLFRSLDLRQLMRFARHPSPASAAIRYHAALKRAARRRRR